MSTKNKNLSIYDINKLPNASNFKIGIVVSNWNKEITENLYSGTFNTLLECNVTKNNITRLDVPGSFELVYACKKLILTNDFDAIIAVGCIIRGETDHFKFISKSVSKGITDLNVIYNTPVVLCVLTDDVIQQSLARSGGELGNKGVEAAITAIKLAQIKLNYT